MDEFLDRYAHGQQLPDETNPPGQEQKGAFEKAAGFVVRHPIISLAAIVLPAAFLISAEGTLSILLLCLTYVALVYLNAGILYITSTMARSTELSFSRLVWYSVPLSFIIQFLSPLGIIIPFSLFSVIAFTIIFFALDFNIGLWKVMLLTLLMYFANIVAVVGIALILASVAN